MATATLASKVDGSLAIDTPLLPLSEGNVAIKRRRTGEGDVTMFDLAGQDDCLAPALAVAQQISADDAQEMTFAAHHERALELEEEALEAKASYLQALASRGGQ